MRIYECDRCGKLVEQDFLHRISFPYRGIYRFGKKGHVCDECAKSFRNWFFEFKNKKNSERP